MEQYEIDSLARTIRKEAGLPVTPAPSALDLYEGSFKYERGYIWDAKMKMVSDNADQDPIQRVRGWGGINGKYPEPEKLQDAIGEHIALALTEYWERNKVKK